MSAQLGHPALVQHQNLIRMENSANTLRHNNPTGGRAKDFKGSIGKLAVYMGKYKFRLMLMFLIL